MPPRTITRRTVRREVSEDDRPVAEDEETQPVGRRAARRATAAVPSSKTKEYDPEAEAAGDDEGEEEEDKGARAERRKGLVKRGWGGYRQTKAEGSDFPDNFSPTKEPQLFIFLEDEPFASYLQHWIEREGKKSWTCGKKDCPLCDVGDKPQSKTCLNVAVLEDDEWRNMVWTVGTRVAEVLQNYASDTKTGPLATRDPMMYWSVTRTGKGGKSQTNINPVKERDLADDWGIAPLTDDDIAAMAKNCFDESSIPVHTKKQLKEIADELDDDEED